MPFYKKTGAKMPPIGNLISDGVRSYNNYVIHWAYFSGSFYKFQDFLFDQYRENLNEPKGFVIPAKAGIHCYKNLVAFEAVDPRLRGDDGYNEPF
jgi:hypothetical protein